MNPADLSRCETPAQSPLVVFDLDGTLIDSVPLCASIINDMLAARGQPRRIQEDDVRPLASGGGGALVNSLLGPDIIDPVSDLAEFRARYAEAPTPVSSLYPGVVDGLHGLADLGVRLAICSNKPQLLCDKITSDLQINHLFAAVVGSRTGVPLKPEVELLEIAINVAGGAGEKLIYVGDSEVDIALTQPLNIELVLVRYGYGAFEGAAWKSAAVDNFEAACSHIKSALLVELANSGLERLN